MNSFNPYLRVLFVTLLIWSIFIHPTETFGQGCANADFENGNFTGWTGTWGDGICTSSFLGICLTSAPDPYQYNGLNIGAVNQSATSTPEKNHFIMTGGNDPIAGAAIPVVFQGTYSMRLGNAQAEDGGETIKYSFVVNNSNVNFTYHYAVVLGGGSHGPGDQAYFKIRMTDGSGNPIGCATYDVDATTAGSVGGFVNAGGNMYKPWSSVFIPLNNYIGQTVTIEFITRDCNSNGGSHFAYAYIEAECAPLEIISSSPTVCGGQNEYLTAPAGAATYSWTGPGVVAPTGNQQIATINLAGQYTVTMTTFGNTPCTFSLDTIIDPAASNPIANFSYAQACAGTPMQFTDLSTPTGGISTWAWDFNGDAVPDAMTQNPTYTFASPGTYPVRLLVASNPCLDDTTINVQVLSVPTSTFTVTTPICDNVNSTITYTGNANASATYTWNFDGGTVVSGSGQGPYQINWTTAGTKNVSLTVSLGSCSSTPTTNSVVVNATPVLTLTPDLAICDGQSTTLTAGGATSYTWSPSTGLSATSGATVTANPIATTTYTVTGTNAGCTATGAVTVTVNPMPQISVSPASATVCEGTTTTFTGNGANTYAWSPATGLSATTGTSVDASPLTTTTYTLTGTSLGCSSTLNFTVTVNPVPVLVLSPDATLCGGGSTTLTAAGGTTYNWSPAAGLSATSGASVTANPATTTTYTVVANSNGCNDIGTVTVNVNPVPVVSVSPLTSTVCAGTSTALTALGATNYTWTPATGLSATTGASVVATPLTTTTYTVTGNSLGCTASATADITVNVSPTLVVSPAVALCGGQTTTMTASGATTYAWSPAAGLSATTGASVNATPASSTLYTVTGTSAGCSTSATIDVQVTPYPNVSISPASFSICEGDSKVFTASGATTYVWSPGASLNTTVGPSVTALPATTTTYQVVGSTNGCNDTAFTTLTVNPIPITTVSPDVTICSGTSTPLVAAGATSYSWTPATGLSSAAGASVNANPLTTTTYTVTGTSAGCSSTAITTVTVNPTPTVTVSPSATAYCDGGSATLTANGAATYTWSPATGLSATTGASVTANPTVTTVYTVVGSSLGCTNNASSTITVHPNPVVDFVADEPNGCVTHCPLFTNLSTIASGSMAYVWDFGDGSTATSSAAQHCYPDTGSYTISLTATSNNQCITQLVKNNYINVYPNPIAGFTADPTTTTVLNPKFQFTDASVGATEWYWNFGDGITLSNLVPSPSHVFPTTMDNGSYTITQEVRNQYGCLDRTAVDVYITPNISIYIPNTFSPNADGRNDVFRAYGENIVEFTMQVFNRWGQELFFSAVMEEGWDGTYLGKQVENDVYVYRITYRGSDDSSGKPIGSVTLFR